MKDLIKREDAINVIQCVTDSPNFSKALGELLRIPSAEQTEPNSSEKPNNCETQTCEDCKHNGEKHAYDYACDKCTDMDKFQHEDEPQTDCSWR